MHGAPTSLTNLPFNIWPAPRIARLMRHHIRQPVHAPRGFPAGDAHADVGIKVHAPEECDLFVPLHSELLLSSYIDDSSLGVEADANEELISAAARIRCSFFVTVNRLAATTNDKLAMICSHSGVGSLVAEEFGLLVRQASVQLPTLAPIRLDEARDVQLQPGMRSMAGAVASVRGCVSLLATDVLFQRRRLQGLGISSGLEQGLLLRMEMRFLALQMLNGFLYGS
eukprot:908207-Pyramimonas_sp.AAC.1